MRSLFLAMLSMTVGACSPEINSQHQPTRNDLTYAADVVTFNAQGCPIGLVNGLPLDDEFGPGTAAITRCLERRQNIQVVYSLNKTCADANCTKSYGIGNIKNAINDYEITHVIPPGSGYRIAVVLYSQAVLYAINNNSPTPYAEVNPFQAEIEALLAKGVVVYLCQNSARSSGVKTTQIIPGVRYVTSGVTAIADFQSIGYSHIAP